MPRMSETKSLNFEEIKASTLESLVNVVGGGVVDSGG